jgi:hypothetical protein
MPTRFDQRPLLLTMFGPVRRRSMRVTDRFQTTIADIVARYRPNLEKRIYVRARARLFKPIDVLEIADGSSLPILPGDLKEPDLHLLEIAARSNDLRWCLTPLAEISDNPFPYNCEIIVDR